MRAPWPCHVHVLPSYIIRIITFLSRGGSLGSNSRRVEVGEGGEGNYVYSRHGHGGGLAMGSR